MERELRLVAVNGMLGYGYPLESLDRAVEARPHLFGVDAGSTDAGPYYLGQGVPLTAPRQIERDLRGAYLAARRAGVPLVVGSAGFGGATPHVDLVLGILDRIVREDGRPSRCAVIRSDVPASLVAAAAREKRLTPLAGAPEADADRIAVTDRIVAQMGTEPIAKALAMGVDVVLAGRACDTAIYAALPISRGFDAGLAIHMAKIMECGAQCALPLAPNDSLLGTISTDSFELRTLNPNRTLTPESVAAHTLYEQPDPYEIHEPEGTVNMQDAEFVQVDPHTVRVSGSRLMTPDGPTRIKLEGARRVGYRAVTFAGVRDPRVIEALNDIVASAKGMAFDNLAKDVNQDSLSVAVRAYGRDAVMGELERPRDHVPHEVGILVEVVGPSQQVASDALALLRSSLLHCPFPGRKTTAGNLAFPFSPSDVAAGPVYEFSVYHLIDVEDPMALFPIEMLTLGGVA